MSVFGYFMWVTLAVCAGGFAMAAGELVADWRDGRGHR